MSLLHQTDEGSAHRDHVVVGVRREDHYAFREGLRGDRARRIVGVGLAAGPSGDGVLQVVEDVDVDLVVGAALFEQFAQRVFDIVLVGKFQNRFLHHAAKPYHCLADELGRPAAGPDQPWRLFAGEQLCGVLVDDHFDVGVGLEVGGRHLPRDFALDHALDDRGLLLAPGHQDDLLGAHDGADAHRDSHLGRVLQSEEGSRLDFAGVVGELYQPCARFGVGAGLVEADLSVLTHADDHQIDLAHRMVVRGAVLRNLVFGDRSVRNADVFGQNVDVVEEILVDAVVAALLFGGTYRIELVEAEYGYVAETHESLPVTLDQLAVESQRGTARRQSQHEWLRLFVDLVRAIGLVIGADGLDDGVGDVLHAEVFVFEDRRVDFLAAVDDVPRG